jgi:hypothetical protein
MPTIGNLPATTLPVAAADATVLPLENSAGTATEKVTTQQLREAILRPDSLTTVASPDVTGATLFLVQVPGLTAPENRKLTLTQLRSLANTRTAIRRQIASRAKAGATAGWVVAATNNQAKLGTLPVSQTGSTLVVPLEGLQVGDTITAFTVFGSIQAAGNTGTLTADLRVLTNDAAGAVDASIEAFAAPVSVTANTLLNEGNARVALATPEVVARNKRYYLLITSTTGAAVTQEVLHAELELTTA